MAHSKIMSNFHRQSTQRQLSRERLNYILQLQKVENAFFTLHIGSHSNAIFQKYREETAYSNFHFVIHYRFQDPFMAEICV